MIDNDPVLKQLLLDTSPEGCLVCADYLHEREIDPIAELYLRIRGEDTIGKRYHRFIVPYFVHRVLGWRVVVGIIKGGIPDLWMTTPSNDLRFIRWLKAGSPWEVTCKGVRLESCWPYRTAMQSSRPYLDCFAERALMLELEKVRDRNDPMRRYR